MIRRAFLIKLKPGGEEGYRSTHGSVPVLLEAELKAHGVSNYSIFLHKPTGYLVCYMEVSDPGKFSKLSSSLVCREWWESMTEFLETPDPLRGKAWEEELEQVYYLI
jgi:L-rhamnose mutarotase